MSENNKVPRPTERSHILNTRRPSRPTQPPATGRTPQQRNAKKTPSNTATTTIIAVGATTGSNTAQQQNQPPINSPPDDSKHSISTSISPSSIANDDMCQLVHEMDMEEEGSKSSLSHASYNYINSILGSGVIGMPYALHQAGLFAGLILMIVVAVITDYSLVLMVRAGHLSGTFTYQGVMESAFGRPGFYILSFLQFCYPLIAMISYNVIVGDTLTKVLLYFTAVRNVPSETVEFQREGVVLLVTLFVTLPLSLYRDVAKLSKVSFLSLVSIAIILLSIIIRLGTMSIVPSPDAWTFIKPGGIIQAIGVFAFAFMCHHNTFMLYSSMKNTNEQKWGTVTHISVGTSLIVSLVFSLVGYATFTGFVQGDLLENYCWDDDLINLARFLFCLTILLTFPLECFVARDVIENICFSGKQPSTASRHFGITLLIVLASYVISISTDCLGVVLELNGILAAMPLAYILPALCYIRLDPSPFLSKQKLPAIATATFGALVSLTGLMLLLVNGPSTEHCSHGQPMPYCSSPPLLPLNATLRSLPLIALNGTSGGEILPHPQQ